MGTEKVITRLTNREDGVVAAEFAILLPVFLLIFVGLVELGHLWHLQHTVTNASREGARAAIVYTIDQGTGQRLDCTQVTNVAKTAVTTYLSKFGFPYSVNTDVTTPLTGCNPSGTQDRNVNVKVTATGDLMILLDKLVPAFGSISVEAETTMRLE